MAYQQASSRMLQALSERGLGEINQAHFGLFQYPPIDGLRPIDVAKRLKVSKQAVYYLLGQLEKLGFLERRREEQLGHTVVYLTERGWLVLESNVATMRTLEEDWQRQIGKRRFTELKAALQELTRGC